MLPSPMSENERQPCYKWLMEKAVTGWRNMGCCDLVSQRPSMGGLTGTKKKGLKACTYGPVGAANQRGRLDCATEEEAKEAVQEVLAQSPQQFGLRGVRWTLSKIQEAVNWLRNKTEVGVWKVMGRLGFSYQQAASFTRSPDPFFRLKVRAMRQAFAHALSYPTQAVILFQDELSYYRTPTLAPAWGHTGQSQPRVAKSSTTDTLTRIGAMMDGITGRVLYAQGDKFGIAAMRDLYRAVRQHYDQPVIYVVQDNCPSVHQHPSVLATADDLAITPVFLPTYSSWLNPIEKLWRWLKATILHNHPWAHDLHRLRSEVAGFLNTFSQPSPALLRYVGLLPV